MLCAPLDDQESNTSTYIPEKWKGTFIFFIFKNQVERNFKIKICLLQFKKKL